MKPRYQIVISLSEDDNAQLQKLRAEGYQIVDIFRLGLAGAQEAQKKHKAGGKHGAQDKLF